MLYLWVYFSHPPSVGWGAFSRQPKLVLTLRKILVVGAWRMLRIPIASTGFGPTLTTMTKLFARWSSILTKMSAGFSATVSRTSNLFSGQRRSRILRCLQIVALIAVLFVDCEECLCIIVGFLPSARHAIVCILFSLEQSRVVD